MASTKLPARLLDTSEVPNLNISETGLGIGTTSTNALINLVEDNSRSSKTGTAQGQIHISGGTDLSNGDVSGITFSTNSLAQVSSIIGNTITNSGSSLFFGTSNSYVSGVTNTALLIDHAGHVGIGHTSPDFPLVVRDSTTSNYLKVIGATNGNAGIAFGDDDAELDGGILFKNDTKDLRFFKGGFTEAARIDSSGNFMVGGTTAYGADMITLGTGGFLAVRNTGAECLELRRDSSFGPVINLEKDGTANGVIGAYTTSRMYMGSGDTGLVFYPGGDAIYPINASTPAARDNAISLGILDARFDNIVATNGSIVTSDRNEKNTIADSDLGLDFVKRLSPKSYKFNGKTRTHYGLIAQDVETVLSDINKSTTDFAGFIKGDTSEEQDGSSYKYGLRYNEFISPLIKAIQEQQEQIEAMKKEIEELKG